MKERLDAYLKALPNQKQCVLIAVVVTVPFLALGLTSPCSPCSPCSASGSTPTAASRPVRGPRPSRASRTWSRSPSSPAPSTPSKPLAGPLGPSPRPINSAPLPSLSHPAHSPTYSHLASTASPPSFSHPLCHVVAIPLALLVHTIPCRSLQVQCNPPELNALQTCCPRREARGCQDALPGVSSLLSLTPLPRRALPPRAFRKRVLTRSSSLRTRLSRTSRPGRHRLTAAPHGTRVSLHAQLVSSSRPAAGCCKSGHVIQLRVAAVQRRLLRRRA